MNEPISAKNETDLMDYIRIATKRKWLVFFTFFMVVVATSVFTFLIAKKIYKIYTSIEIGRIGENIEGGAGIIENPGQVTEKVKSDVYGIPIRQKLNIPEASYPRIEVDNPRAGDSSTQLVNIVINSNNSELAKNILAEIDNLIINDHANLIKAKVNLLNQDIVTEQGKITLMQNNIANTVNKMSPIDDNIARIEDKIKFSEDEKNNLQAKVDALQKVLPYQQDPGTQFALFDAKEKLANKQQEIEDLYLNINSLRQSKEDLGVQVNSLKTAIEDSKAKINSISASIADIIPTKVIKDPAVSAIPVSPKPVINIVISMVFGLFLGLCFAFGGEWWEASKNKNFT